MAYYDSIRSKSSYWAAVSSRQSQNSQALQSSTHQETTALHWGIDHLFAWRVICKPPSAILPFFQCKVEFAEAGKDEWHQVIRQVIDGPRESISALSKMSQAEIFQSYSRGPCGLIWADLAILLQPEAPNSDPTPPTVRPNPQNAYLFFYLDCPVVPCPAEVTVNFASSLIRTILSFSQPPDERSSTIEYRGRLRYRGENSESVDEGGIEAIPSGMQVALLEAKRLFQHMENGRPVVSDNLLSQVVGVALDMKDSHYIKFFHLTIPDAFYARFKTLSLEDDTADLETFLQVESTEWLDGAEVDGRRSIVHHIMALVMWADHIVTHGESNGNPDGKDESMDTSS
ncbi:uncharacterized protein TRIVIDRAFT_60979 [Trichoderma virens Gv29-8]|uniref:Uncharacterized protein n=1 Tax=Hypocrea virens (strain Gv29-8 / FGSC 10586) TaxID=413071 RepID=G9MSC8_HYPVG|nr:uncharacterized protein TRIVIDRAFT_60979 [Trichoderma virens Gv29-8]EHK22145.1 hypothetical protein TRIVIDRAFT_60979 [Trichoderma virens Gv29-8]UKZ47176.1 hypothetical protein TrVGV298_001390 [Trichoderma virens]